MTGPAETKHRMTRRLNGWDYGQRAIYMVTVTLAERGRPVLAGWPEENHGNLGAEAQNGEEAQNSHTEFCASPRAAKFLCPLTPLGENVLKCWREIPSRWPMVSLLEAVVMPDHFHGIVVMKPGSIYGLKDFRPHGRQLENLAESRLLILSAFPEEVEGCNWDNCHWNNGVAAAIAAATPKGRR